ncbi:autophagy-related protein 11-like [Bidens hawaiensis]|uniref:autophagy-related protein 11-like n=1 Tax=Bidens hawaiensis TaxID=980011 RepID=UPI0040497DE7
MGVGGDDVAELQNILGEKSNQLTDLEAKLEAAEAEVGKLERDLLISRNLLDESQMNCVHLGNCLREAREEAQTHLCAANNRASDYNKLRGSALKIRTLFERLKSSVSSADVSSFADSLQSLAQSLTNSANDNGDDGTATELRECVHVLAKRVGILVRHRAELIDRYTKAEAAQQQLTKELDQSKEQTRRKYRIVGQVVHIERQIVKPSSVVQAECKSESRQSGLVSGPTEASPYGLAVGCEFFVVTVAMLPDTAVHPPPGTAS